MEQYDLLRIERELDSRPSWKVEQGSLVRRIRFRDFAAALGSLLRIGEAAERLGHHPDLSLHYNLLELRVRTHSANAITNLDFELVDAIGALEPFDGS